MVKHAQLCHGHVSFYRRNGRRPQPCCNHNILSVEVPKIVKSGGQFPVCDQGHACMIIGYAEVDLQVAVRSDPHAPDNDVELPCEECRDNTGPLGGDKFHLDAHIPCKSRGHLHLKPGQLPCLVLHGPGHKRGHADLQDFAFEHLFQGTLPGQLQLDLSCMPPVRGCDERQGHCHDPHSPWSLFHANLLFMVLCSPP